MSNRMIEKMIKTLAEAERLKKAGNFAGALKQYSLAVSYDPAEAGTMGMAVQCKLGSAECLIVMGQLDQAMQPLSWNNKENHERSFQSYVLGFDRKTDGRLFSRITRSE